MRKKTCSAPGCNKNSWSGKLCPMHVSRMRKYGSLSLPTREQILLKNIIENNNGCWILQKWIANTGYGRFEEKGISVSAHRWSFENWIGPIPPGMDVLHSCDTPACVNPSHLFTGTHSDNMIDRAKKARSNVTPLMASDIQAIRVDKRPLKDISEQYGVATSTISRIKNKVRWGWLT